MTHTHYNIFIITTEASSEHSQTSKMEIFAKIVTGSKTPNIFAKIS